MEPKILFAKQNDEEELREILWEHGMDISGEIENHLVVKDNNQVLAGGKIVESEINHFYLELFGVKQDKRDQGLGGFLLSAIVQAPRKYCKDRVSEPQSCESYQMTTISRGEAAGFYKSYGFEPCSFSKIPEQYREQCDECPVKEECKPVPMILFGG